MIKITTQLTEEVEGILVDIQSNAASLATAQEIEGYIKKYNHCLEVQTSTHTISIPFRDIVSFEKGDAKKAILIQYPETSIETNYTLMEIAKILESLPFFTQINRQTFINMYFITSFKTLQNTRIEIGMKNNDRHIINRGYLKSFMNQFSKI